MNKAEKSSQSRILLPFSPADFFEAGLRLTSSLETPHLCGSRARRSSSGDGQHTIQILTRHLIALAECYLPHEVIVEFLLDYVYKKRNAMPIGKCSINGIYFYHNYYYMFAE